MEYISEALQADIACFQVLIFYHKLAVFLKNHLNYLNLFFPPFHGKNIHSGLRKWEWVSSDRYRTEEIQTVSIIRGEVE